MDNFLSNASHPCVAAAVIAVICTIIFYKIQQRKNDADYEALFNQRRNEECPICMISLPTYGRCTTQYQSCCGKELCFGCIYADTKADNRMIICPFCRTPMPTSDREIIERIKERAAAGDARAINILGGYYYRGVMGLPQDYGKAMELLLRAGELGCVSSYAYIADAHFYGEGVERDIKKAQHYWELAVIGGDVDARHNLGCIEAHAGNMNRAVKHWMMSAGAGLDHSLKKIREGFLKGYATKADFEKA